MPNGADISAFQGDLEPSWFDQWDFVVVRAFDRHGNLDDLFHQNWQNATGRTLRGAYGWPKPGADNHALGANLAAVAGDGEFGLWADYEWSEEYGFATVDELEAYLAGMGEVRKGVYANAFAYPYGSGADLYPWWIANYGGHNDGERHPFAYRDPHTDEIVPLQVNRPWEIHQFTSKGDGPNSRLDLNFAPTLDLWGTPQPEVQPVAFLTRADWGADPPLWPSAGWPQGEPTSYTLHYEGSDTPTDYDRERYTQIVDAIQRYHQTHGYNDIAYNFVVSPFGDIYEAHGWDERSAAQYDGNPKSVAICYIGGPGTELTDAAKTAFRSLLDRHPDFPIYPHKHWTPTSCPGAAIEEWINAGCPAPTTTPPAPKPKEGEMRLFRDTDTNTWTLWDGFNWTENVPGEHVWNLAVGEIPASAVPGSTLHWLKQTVGQNVEALVKRIRD